ncbi:TetR/AcrR family transcriptional regulator [Gordonia hydrophobica]|uniref:TetR/AcrR family transcriptional regulator n=1 Tax=Gordonia hydrophobica TaxID=40516 RepID=A0ABZ2U6U4_9ACTN|nr:TetR/AcrR family transcriptional regulator [Gordonia hydrophobica]MBM7365335.1 AcrR family transcriptional regulator [Gordonia hydrophobica]
MARKRATTVDAVVDAAARVFERKGYVDATIADIAAEAGVSKPTVYQYAPNKRWLLETIVEQVIYPLRASIDEIVESDDPLREKLLRYLAVQVDSTVRYRGYYAVLIADQHQLSPEALADYKSWAHDVNRITADLLESCADAGVVRADVDPTTMANLIIGMMMSVSRWYDEDGKFGPDEILSQSVRLLSGYIVS